MLVSGTEYKGSCDYFTYNDEEFHVKGRMHYCRLCPLYVDDAVLCLSRYPGYGITVTEVPNIRCRCFFWTAVRWYVNLASVIALFIGLLLLRGSSLVGGLVITLALVGAFTGVAAVFHKPKATTENEAIYIDMLRRHSSSSATVPLTVQPIPQTELQNQHGLP